MEEPLVRAYRADAPLDVPALVARVRGRPLALLRADRVCGADHLRLAALLAARAVAQGRARTAGLPTETLLYAAGERQIGRAIAFLGLRDDSRAVAAVAWDADALDALAAEQGWARDDALLAGGDAALDAFGVSETERAMLPPARRCDLVLERVALVDVAKP